MISLTGSPVSSDMEGRRCRFFSGEDLGARPGIAPGDSTILRASRSRIEP